MENNKTLNNLMEAFAGESQKQKVLIICKKARNRRRKLNA